MFHGKTRWLSNRFTQINSIVGSIVMIAVVVYYLDISLGQFVIKSLSKQESFLTNLTGFNLTNIQNTFPITDWYDQFYHYSSGLYPMELEIDTSIPLSEEVSFEWILPKPIADVNPASMRTLNHTHRPLQ